ncbi:MAG: GNAT family N-acetyltransferase [Acidobacteria bacterium]|nr:GNAT family N-acetyltransferase [Acidobacteriota bacterium]
MTHRKITVRLASHADFDFVHQIDHDLSVEVAARKIDAQEAVIAESNGIPVGYVRLQFLWSLIPFVALIHVLPEHQHQGVGRALMAFVEERLRSQGRTALYSSSQADEAEPQAWHRHIGFEECGIIAGINAGGVGEIFFRKQL